MNMDIEQISDIVKRVMKESGSSKEVQSVNACGVPVHPIVDTEKKEKSFLT